METENCLIAENPNRELIQKPRTNSLFAFGGLLFKVAVSCRPRPQTNHKRHHTTMPSHHNTRSAAKRTREEDAAATAAATAASTAAAGALAAVAAVQPPRKRARTHSAEELREIHYATLMQRFRTRKLAADGGNFGMTSAVAKTLPYADLSTRLRDTSLIHVMKLILHRVCVLTAEGVRSFPGAEDTKNVNVRVFVASFMIAYHPNDVFESINELETDLHLAAVAMLEVFDTLCIAIIASKRGTDLTEPIKKALNFPGVLHTYLKAFQAWKLPDEAKLTARITHALTALYEADDHLVEGDTETPKLRAEFGAQQERLRNKLVQIAGEKALKKLDDLRESQGLTRARIAVNNGAGAAATGEGSGYSALPRRMTNEQMAHELLLDSTFTLDEHGGNPGPKRNTYRVTYQP
jgi:hypothetical protein